MKLNLNPMTTLRESAIKKVNEHFNVLSAQNLHKDRARAQKRELAKRALSGADTFTLLEVEARIRNISAEDLANIIVSKPDDLYEREIQRQRVFKEIEETVSPDDIDVILSKLRRE